MRLLVVEKSAPIAGLIDAHIGVIGHQNDPRPGLHMAVVGDVVINPVAGLNPAVKDVDKIRQWNLICLSRQKL